jgi:xylulokinase
VVNTQGYENARYFLGWSDFLALRMTGRPATDPSTASRYAVYELRNLDWSAERVAHYGIETDLLPELLPWPSVIGELTPGLADAWGISNQVQVTLGGHDINCAVIGVGVSEPGEACLISGSYENLMVMTNTPPTGNMLLRGLSVMPHPGGAGYAALAVCPTGNAVLNWARDRLGTSIEAVEADLLNGSLSPSPVMVIPYLSGSMTYWKDGRKAKGAIVGLTLATRPLDIVQAFMESIAYDDANTLALLEAEGVPVKRIRATGGGARSTWWTQLKADISNRPIEVVEVEEAGTLGAAILAGAAIGVYDDIVKPAKHLPPLAGPSAKRSGQPSSR